MSVGFGLAAIRASRERGHRDDRWQARRLHLFQPRLRGGRRRFPGGGRPPTPGAPLLRISRRQHRALGPHSRAILKDSLAPLGSARAGNPAGPADACHRPRVRGLRRPSGSLYRSGSPSDRPDSVVFSHPLPDRSAILLASFTYAVSLPIVDEGPAIPAGTSLMRGIQSVTRYLAIGCYEMNGLMFIVYELISSLRISVHLSLCLASG